jgi:4-amino-4-deoxy-L-arabinose transferase-like glycosyltransferase
MNIKLPLPGAAVAAVLFLAICLSRLPVLHRSVLDWDESLYFLMADQWLHGALPYSNIWDNKPVGIYAIFAGFQTLFGVQVFAMRAATVLFISLVAFAVFNITEHLTQHRAAAWLAGVALALCSLSNDGLSANTELFMACFTALALWAALATRSGLLVGVLLGAAFMVKYVAIFEAPCIFFLFLWRQRRLSAAAAMLTGASLPLACVVLLYAMAGRLGLWWDCSVLANLRRVNAPFTPASLHYALHTELWRWGPMLALGLAILPVALARRRALFLARRRATEIFLSFWLLGGMAGVVSAKSFYDHYFQQLLPVLCVSLGYWFSLLPRRRALQCAFAAATLILPARAAQIALHDAAGPDIPARIAADLNAAHPSGIYVFDSQPILYALTRLPPPTRYVLPSELTGVLLPGVAGVNAQAEVARILATRPQFIIRRSDPSTDPAVINPAIYAELNTALATGYRPWRQYPGVDVYELK